MPDARREQIKEQRATNNQLSRLDSSSLLEMIVDEQKMTNDQLNMFNSDKLPQLISFGAALVAEAQKQTNLLATIAQVKNIPGAVQPQEVQQETAMPSEKEGGSNIEVVSALHEISSTLHAILNAQQSQSDQTTTQPLNPSEGVIAAIATGKGGNAIIELGKMIAVIGGSMMILGLGLNLLKGVDYKQVLLITGSIAVLFVGLKQLADVQFDLKTALSSLLFIGGSIAILATAFKYAGEVNYENIGEFFAAIAVLVLSLSLIAKADIDFRQIILFQMFTSAFISSITQAIAQINEIEVLNSEKINSIYQVSGLIVSVMTLFSYLPKMSFKTLMGITFGMGTVASLLVDSSMELSKMETISKDKLFSIGGITAVMIPAYTLLARAEETLSLTNSVSLSIFGFALPKLAMSIVETSKLIAQVPKSLDPRQIAMIIMLTAGLRPFIKNTMKVFGAITPQALQLSGFDLLMRKGSYTKAGGFQFSMVGNETGQYIESNLNILARLSMSLAVLPLLTVIMLTTAALFSKYADMGGKFIAPPLGWSVNVGVAMYLFSSALGQILYSLQGKSVTRSAGQSTGATTRKGFFGTSSIGASMIGETETRTASNWLPAVGVILSLSILMVATGYIMSNFPKGAAERNIPSVGWIFGVGFGLRLFANAFARIVETFDRSKEGLGAPGPPPGAGFFQMVKWRIGNSALPSGVSTLLLLAGSIVAVGYIMSLFPPKPKAPPLGWTISVGIAMYLFAGAFRSIAQVSSSTSSGGLMGLIMGGARSKNTEMSGVQGIVGAGIITVLALSIVAVGYIFRLFPQKTKAPPIGFSLSAGLSLILFAKAIAVVSKTASKIDIGKKARTGDINISEPGALAKAGGALATTMALSLGIVATAWIFQLLPSKYKSPPIGWTIKTGLALVAFALPIGMIMKAMNKAKMKDTIPITDPRDMRLQKSQNKAGVLAFIGVIALSILVTAWLFKLLPTTYNSPDILWTIQTGLAIFTFGAAIIGLNRFMDLDSMKDVKRITIASLAIPFIITNIVLAAWMFKALPTTYKAPDLMWSIKVGMSILAVGASIIALDKFNIGMNELLEGVGKVAIIAGSLVTMAWIFQLLPDGKLKAPTLLFSLFAGTALLIVAGSLAFMGAFNENIEAGTRSLDNVLLASVAIVAIMYIAGKTQVTPTTASTFLMFTGIVMGLAVLIGAIGFLEKNIRKGAEALTMLSIPLILITGAFFLWSQSNITWTTLATFGGAMLVIGLMVMIAGGKGIPGTDIGAVKPKDIREGAVSLSMLALPILAFAFAFKVLDAAMPKPSGEFMLKIGIVALTIGVLGGAIVLLDYLKLLDPKKIALGALVMSLLAVPVAAMGFALGMLDKAIPNPTPMWEKMALAGTAILVLGGAAIGIGAIISSGIGAVAVFGGLAALAGVGVVMMIIAAGLEALNKAIDLEKTTLFKDSGHESFIFGNPISNFEYMMEAIAYGFALNPVTAAFMAIGIPAFLGAGIALITLSKSIEKIGNMDPKALDMAGEKIPEMLNLIGDAFEEIGKKNKGGLIFKGVIEDGVQAMLGAGRALGDIAVGVANFANMKFTDSKGKTITLAEGDLYKVRTNIYDVMTTLTDAFAMVGEANKQEMDWKDTLATVATGGIFGIGKMLFGKGPVAEGIAAVSGAGAILTEIAKGLTDFAVLKFLDPETKKYINLNGKLGPEGVVGQNIISVITTITQAFAAAGRIEQETKWNAVGKAMEQGGIFGLGTAIFGSGDVSTGIEAIAGSGALLSEIAKSLADFAVLKFWDPEKKAYVDLSGKLGADGIVGKNITDVITMVAGVFSKVGTDFNSGSTWFSRGNVEIGRDAVEGVGKELFDIVSAIKDIAIMKIKDPFDEKKVIDVADLLKPVKNADGTTSSSIIESNIVAILTVVGKAFSTIGEQYNSGSTWFTKGGIEAGRDAVKGIGKDLVDIVGTMQKIATLIESGAFKDGATKFTVNVMEVLLAMPRGVLAVANLLKDKEDIVEETVDAIKSISSVSVMVGALTKFSELTKDLDTEKMGWIPWLMRLIPLGVQGIMQLVNDKDNPLDYKLGNAIILALGSAFTSYSGVIKSIQLFDTFDPTLIPKYNTVIPAVLTILPGAMIHLLEVITTKTKESDFSKGMAFLLMIANAVTSYSGIINSIKLFDSIDIRGFDGPNGYDSKIPRVLSVLPSAIIDMLQLTINPDTKKPYEYDLLSAVIIKIANSLTSYSDIIEGLKIFDAISMQSIDHYNEVIPALLSIFPQAMIDLNEVLIDPTSKNPLDYTRQTAILASIINTASSYAGMVEVVQLFDGFDATIISKYNTIIPETLKIMPLALMNLNTTVGYLSMDGFKNLMTFLAVLGNTTRYEDLIASIQTFDDIDSKDISDYAYKIPKVLTLIPEALMEMNKSLAKYKTGGLTGSFAMLSISDKLTASIEIIASKDKPIENIAMNLAKAAKGMVAMKEGFSGIDYSKLEKLTTMFGTIKDIVYPNGVVNPYESFPEDLARAMDGGLKTAMESSKEIVDRMEKIAAISGQSHEVIKNVSGDAQKTNALLLEELMSMKQLAQENAVKIQEIAIAVRTGVAVDIIDKDMQLLVK